jgi:hypothetical protein
MLKAKEAAQGGANFKCRMCQSEGLEFAMVHGAIKVEPEMSKVKEAALGRCRSK